MDTKFNFEMPYPIVDDRELNALDKLSEKYNRLSEPGKIARVGIKAGQMIPAKVKRIGKDIGANIAGQELYLQMMKIVAEGFTKIEEQASKYTLSEKNVLERLSNATHTTIHSIDEICLLRSYDISKVVNKHKGIDMVTALVEGASTGVAGFWGLPFNLVISTFLYYRSIQSIAMFYGYDVKNDSGELVIASEVFTNALSPSKNDTDNELSTIIMKIMIASQAEVVKQTAKKTWTDMAARGGIPLLITQMRALANKSAQKALQNVGAKGLEGSLFKDAFEQIGRKLTLKNTAKMAPAVSAIAGGLIDTAQMMRVFEYAEVFYQKRFILEKQTRILKLTDEDIILDPEIINLQDGVIEVAGCN